MENKEKKYTGQKKISGVYQTIINEIPLCSRFCEAFAGSAQISQILMSIVPGLSISLNDIDKSVIDKCNFTSASLLNVTAIEYMSMVEAMFVNDAVMFLDPPYHHDSRPNNKKLYNFEMSNQEHIDLFNYIVGSNLKIILIHPVGCIYDSLINKGWRYKEIKVRYHNKTSIERIFINYEVPSKLLTYNFIGNNFTERQRIKRKIERFSHKLLLLPVQERNAILSNIINNYN